MNSSARKKQSLPLTSNVTETKNRIELFSGPFPLYKAQAVKAAAQPARRSCARALFHRKAGSRFDRLYRAIVVFAVCGDQ